jgi:hypothetical protein
MADDRLASRSPSIAPIIAARLMPRSPAISFKQFQNSSSMLTLVLWPATTIERFEPGDTASPPRMSQQYYIDRMAFRTRKTPGLGATGGAFHNLVQHHGYPTPLLNVSQRSEPSWTATAYRCSSGTSGRSLIRPTLGMAPSPHRKCCANFPAPPAWPSLRQWPGTEANLQRSPDRPR